jgi:hypothetical protein
MSRSNRTSTPAADDASGYGRALGTACLAIALASGAAPSPAQPGPDLRLEWLEAGRARAQAPPLEGRSGERITVAYRLGNSGDRDAFAVILQAFTALGPYGSAERVEPGPATNQRIDRALTLVLSEGMRELCLEARLQNRSAGDPSDPRPHDNRICRRIQVHPPEGVSRRHSVNRAAHHRRITHATPLS